VTTNPKTIAADLAISALSSKPLASDLAAKFAKAGFTLALVGGPVRDAILGRLGNDLDFTMQNLMRLNQLLKKVQILFGKLVENSELSPHNLVM